MEIRSIWRVSGIGPKRFEIKNKNGKVICTIFPDKHGSKQFKVQNKNGKLVGEVYRSFRAGKAYLVRDKLNWYSLPIEARTAAKASINNVFKFGGMQAMQVSAIDEGQVPSNIDLVDGVVRVYANSADALSGYISYITNQVAALENRVPKLKDYKSKLLATRWFTNKIAGGRSFALKKKYEVNKQEHLVCVSEGVISLETAFNKWAEFRAPNIHAGRGSWKLKLSKASPEKKRDFGAALGRLIAHEIRHQLKESGNVPPDTSGPAVSLEHCDLRPPYEELGYTEARWYDPKCEFSPYDKCENIIKSMSNLATLQKTKSTESIPRNKPYAGERSPRITVVGAVQAVRKATEPTPARVVREEDKRPQGVLVRKFIRKLSRRQSANSVAKQIGVGSGFVILPNGKYTLKEKIEPTYVDSGVSVARRPGKALVIGNNSYETNANMGSSGKKNTQLVYSIADASAIKKALVRSRKFPQRNIDFKKDQTGQQIRTLINNAVSTLTPRTLFLFYFSGHGLIEGLVGIDGKTLSPADLVVLVKKAIEVNSDLVILIDACHSGVFVDECRMALLERAKKYYPNNSKIIPFINSAINLAGAKKQFINSVQNHLKKEAEISNLLMSGNDAYEQKQDEFLRGWFRVWNDFAAKAKTKVSNTVQKGLDAGKSVLARVKIEEFKPEEMARTNGLYDYNLHEPQICAELDHLDDLLNLATSVGN